jgi:hypothetical protein
MYLYNMHNILEKHLCISFAPVRSRGGSLVINKTTRYGIRILSNPSKISAEFVISVLQVCPKNCITFALHIAVKKIY